MVIHESALIGRCVPRRRANGRHWSPHAFFKSDCKTMKPRLFCQKAACTILTTMLFSVVVPPEACWCRDCRCENCLSCGFEQERAVEAPSCAACEKHCSESCDGEQPETPCRCCNFPKNHATMPKVFELVKKSNFAQPWSFVSAPPVGLGNVLGFPTGLDGRRGPLYPCVPLYVLLCVFLN